MALSITQQSPVLSALDRFNKASSDNNEKLSSALRINKAADDAAGLQIASRLTSQINGYEQLSRNAQDNISINDTRSAQFLAISDSLQRANILSVQSGNPLADSSAIQDEYNQLTEQINILASDALGVDGFITSLDASDPQTSQAAIENALSSVNEAASAVGAETQRLTTQMSSYSSSYVNVSAARSRIQDTDYTSVSSQQTQSDILLQMAIITKRDDETRKGLLINQLI
jgi:flagellin